MSSLIVLGNTNKHTFANSIVAAHHVSIDNFNSELEDIFIIHSVGSYELLINKESDWIDHLQSNGIDKSSLTHRLIDIESTSESLLKFVTYIESIIKGRPGDQVVITDLTNGTTLHKVFLSIIAYILDLNNLYAINIIKLSDFTKERGYIDPDILKKSYSPAPKSTELDGLAYLNLAEVLRYKYIVEKHTKSYSKINPLSTDSEFFKDNLLHSIHLKLQGDQKKQTDKAIYRIASSALSASIEDLILVLIERFSIGDPTGSTFGQNIRKIENVMRKDAPLDFDLEFFALFNQFMLYLRNSSTHKGRLLTDLEKFKAELSVKMAFPFIQFYTDIVHEVLGNNQSLPKPRRIRTLNPNNNYPDTVMYYGLDGDNTGAILEELFCSASDERSFRRMSHAVSSAIKSISSLIRDSKRGSIVFEAGDDLFFKGKFSYQELIVMQKTYYDKTELTCSIGYGKSFHEVYLALKSAKTEPGKNSIVGIELE